MPNFQNFIKDKRSGRTLFWFVVVLLIIILQFIQIASLSGDSQTVDEGPHLLAGYAFLKTGKILVNPEHPPLLKAWAALPLLILNPQLPPEVERAAQIPAEIDQWRLSGDFLYHNRVSADTMLFWAHIMMLILTAGAAVAVTLVARSLFGDVAGIIAFVLFAFHPTVLAHGRIVTTDVGVSAFIFISVFGFYSFLISPSKKRAVIFATLFAFALLSKFSSLILLPVFAILWGIRWIQAKHDTSIKMPSAKVLFLGFVATCGLVWLLYGLNIEQASRDPKVQDLYARRAVLATDPNAYEGYPLAQFIIHAFDPVKQPGTTLKWLSDNAPVPAYRYFRGLSDFFAHNYRGHDAYLLGHVYQFGIWQYFPVAYLVKTPIPSFLFLVSAICLFAVATLRLRPDTLDLSPSRLRRLWNALRNLFYRVPFIAYVLFVPPAFYFLSSVVARLNLGVRHLLPIEPFIAVIVAGAFALAVKRIPKFSPFQIYQRVFPQPRKVIAVFVTLALIVWFFAESVMIAPYHLAYFNQLVGGPKNGHEYLSDSNIDWGQDFLRLKNYMREKNLDWVYLRYFGKADWDYYGVKGYSVPTAADVAKNGIPRGVVVISVTALFMFNPQEFLWLRDRTPTDRIGYSLWVYDFR